jgi:hypothetical protein
MSRYHFTLSFGVQLVIGTCCIVIVGAIGYLGARLSLSTALLIGICTGIVVLYVIDQCVRRKRPTKGSSGVSTLSGGAQEADKKGGGRSS